MGDAGGACNFLRAELGNTGAYASTELQLEAIFFQDYPSKSNNSKQTNKAKVGRGRLGAEAPLMGSTSSVMEMMKSQAV